MPGPRPQPPRSRDRFVAAARELFLERGYDAASTALIARSAGSAETQMVRLFGGKAGLLEAVLNEGWMPLNDRLRSLAEGDESGREAVLKALSRMVAALERDPDLAFLMLVEERRVRGTAVKISRGLSEFCETVQRLIERGQRDGSIATTLDPAALCAALMGAAEGMIRSRLIDRREKRSDAISRSEMKNVFEFLLRSPRKDS